ncbi:MAG: ATPase, T2SS/T4P/T4SS family [Anaeromicrobium sp.]|jgi:type IV pilus assembly protein PilB|uniref:GspE/PulE family protein n=1 Tax=Anaeromicrobium sp. TaxID=1929132 RepID=UPI0025DF2540|nr:type II/IV secretion system protein [Anaeromicrobium sp.]MCT4596152.1 ATPase, T2SS/T4P/T4SS family [Anaeromicrobium sp.]
MIHNKIGELLIKNGLISEKQLSEALDIQKIHNEKLGRILIKKKYVDEKELYITLSKQLNIPFIELDNHTIDSYIIEIFSKKFVTKNLLIPFYKGDGFLRILMEDPLNISLIEYMQNTTELDIEVYIGTKSHILCQIEKYYDNVLKEELIYELEKRDKEEKDHNIMPINGTSIGTFFNFLIKKAAHMKSSDIHIEPKNNNLIIRFRINGELKVVENLPRSVYEALIQHIKYMCQLNLVEKRIPQDGRYEINIGGNNIDIRISTIPTVYGEKIVFRLLNRQEFIKTRDELGLDKKSLLIYKNMIKRNSGIILISGPTGSGKTTTLYSIINELDCKSKNITTIEDPVEYKMENLNQMEVNEKIKMTFESGLKALLRQDPDVIMIGEIRNKNTAKIAFKASITGHLVLSTIHTKNTFSTILRLKDMGIDPYLISNGLIGVIAQRLVKEICPNCKVAYKNKSFLVGNIKKLYKGVGCNYCNNTGYKGRLGIYEIMSVDNHIKKLINEKFSLEKIRSYGIENGMSTLEKAGLKLLKRGKITLEDFIGLYYSTK